MGLRIFLEKKSNSKRTIDQIKYLIRKNKESKFFLIVGSDNLINFHKWKKWNKIAEISKILVFDRLNYKSKSLKSISFKKLNKKRLQFINFKKVNISSSQLRKI